MIQTVRLRMVQTARSGFRQWDWYISEDESDSESGSGKRWFCQQEWFRQFDTVVSDSNTVVQTVTQ